MSFPSFLPGRPVQRIDALRGSPVLAPGEAARGAARHGGPTFTVLDHPIPEPFRFRTMAMQGAQGTGKTLTILDSLIPRMRRMSDPAVKERLILTDFKSDVTELVLGLRKVLCPDVPVFFLNPFEMFGRHPDPHEFTADPTQITRLVNALSYRKRDARTDDFFDGMARLHLVLLIKILRQRVPGRWTWRHLYHLATSYDLHTEVIKASRLGRQKSGPKVKKTFAGIVSTIEQWLGQYEAAFACWDKSPRLGLDEFLRGRGILIISSPEDQRDSLTPVVRTVLRVARDRLLADTGRDPHSHTTIVLDEFADLEDCVPVILPFFGKSRSARVALICAWQSWPAVCEAHGEGAMKSILDNAGIRVFFGCGADSAEVASRYCLAAEVRRPEWSFGYRTSGPLGLSFLSPESATLGYKTEVRTNVLPGEFVGLGCPSEENMTVRAYLTAAHLPGPVYCEHDYGPLLAFRLRLPVVPAFRPRLPDQMWLKPWDEDDAFALNELFTHED